MAEVMWLRSSSLFLCPLHQIARMALMKPKSDPVHSSAKTPRDPVFLRVQTKTLARLWEGRHNPLLLLTPPVLSLCSGRSVTGPLHGLLSSLGMFFSQSSLPIDPYPKPTNQTKDPPILPFPLFCFICFLSIDLYLKYNDISC